MDALFIIIFLTGEDSNEAKVLGVFYITGPQSLAFLYNPQTENF
jgi:hypothetical protein